MRRMSRVEAVRVGGEQGAKASMSHKDRQRRASAIENTAYSPFPLVPSGWAFSCFKSRNQIFDLGIFED